MLGCFQSGNSFIHEAQIELCYLERILSSNKNAVEHFPIVEYLTKVKLVYGLPVLINS